MDSTQKMILKKVDYIDKIHKTMLLLEKKKERMGLIEEEEEKYTNLKREYFQKYDSMVEDIFDYLVSQLMTPSAKKALERIQSKIPWDGRALITDADYHKIATVASVLKDSDYDEIESNLAILHKEVFLEFVDFLSTESGHIYCTEMARTISFGVDENFNRVIQYLDLRYRDLADLLELHLDTIEVRFEQIDEDDYDDYE